VENLVEALSKSSERVGNVQNERKMLVESLYQSDKRLMQLNYQNASVSARLGMAEEKQEWKRADMLQKELMDYPEKILSQEKAVELDQQRLFEASRSLRASEDSLGLKFVAVDEVLASLKKSVEIDSANRLQAYEHAADATKKLRSDFESLHLETETCSLEEQAIQEEINTIENCIYGQCRDFCHRLNMARYV
jgi:hypothetical protein